MQEKSYKSFVWVWILLLLAALLYGLSELLANPGKPLEASPSDSSPSLAEPLSTSEDPLVVVPVAAVEALPPTMSPRTAANIPIPMIAITLSPLLTIPVPNVRTSIKPRDPPEETSLDENDVKRPRRKGRF